VYVLQVPEMAFGEYWDTCEYTDGVLNYNQVRSSRSKCQQLTVACCNCVDRKLTTCGFTATKAKVPEAVGNVLVSLSVQQLPILFTVFLQQPMCVCVCVLMC
jgi:hypothetical protein